MKLTGKSKEDFYTWYCENVEDMPYEVDDEPCFVDAPISMKYGVYVDWFDSVGIELDVKRVNSPHINRWMYVLKDMNNYGCHLNDYLKNKRCDTRPEARTATIEKANEIYNERNS